MKNVNIQNQQIYKTESLKENVNQGISSLSDKSENHFLLNSANPLNEITQLGNNDHIVFSDEDCCECSVNFCDDNDCKVEADE